MKNEEWLTLSSVARLAEKSEATIRQAAKHGKLPAIRTASGIRLFRRSDVEKFTAELVRKNSGNAQADRREK